MQQPNALIVGDALRERVILDEQAQQEIVGNLAGLLARLIGLKDKDITFYTDTLAFVMSMLIKLERGFEEMGIDKDQYSSIRDAFNKNIDLVRERYTAYCIRQCKYLTEEYENIQNIQNSNVKDQRLAIQLRECKGFMAEIQINRRFIDITNEQLKLYGEEIQKVIKLLTEQKVEPKNMHLYQAKVPTFTAQITTELQGSIAPQSTGIKILDPEQSPVFVKNVLRARNLLEVALAGIEGSPRLITYSYDKLLPEQEEREKESRRKKIVRYTSITLLSIATILGALELGGRIATDPAPKLGLGSGLMKWGDKAHQKWERYSPGDDENIIREAPLSSTLYETCLDEKDESKPLSNSCLWIQKKLGHLHEFLDDVYKTAFRDGKPETNTLLIANILKEGGSIDDAATPSVQDLYAASEEYWKTKLFISNTDRTFEENIFPQGSIVFFGEANDLKSGHSGQKLTIDETKMSAAIILHHNPNGDGSGEIVILDINSTSEESEKYGENTRVIHYALSKGSNAVLRDSSNDDILEVRILPHFTSQGGSKNPATNWLFGDDFPEQPKESFYGENEVYGDKSVKDLLSEKFEQKDVPETAKIENHTIPRNVTCAGVQTETLPAHALYFYDADIQQMQQDTNILAAAIDVGYNHEEYINFVAPTDLQNGLCTPIAWFDKEEQKWVRAKIYLSAESAKMLYYVYKMRMQETNNVFNITFAGFLSVIAIESGFDQKVDKEGLGQIQSLATKDVTSEEHYQTVRENLTNAFLNVLVSSKYLFRTTGWDTSENAKEKIPLSFAYGRYNQGGKFMKILREKFPNKTHEQLFSMFKDGAIPDELGDEFYGSNDFNYMNAVWASYGVSDTDYDVIETVDDAKIKKIQKHLKNDGSSNITINPSKQKNLITYLQPEIINVLDYLITKYPDIQVNDTIRSRQRQQSYRNRGLQAAHPDRTLHAKRQGLAADISKHKKRGGKWKNSELRKISREINKRFGHFGIHALPHGNPQKNYHIHIGFKDFKGNITILRTDKEWRKMIRTPGSANISATVKENGKIQLPEAANIENLDAKILPLISAIDPVHAPVENTDPKILEISSMTEYLSKLKNINDGDTIKLLSGFIGTDLHFEDQHWKKGITIEAVDKNSIHFNNILLNRVTGITFKNINFENIDLARVQNIGRIDYSNNITFDSITVKGKKLDLDGLEKGDTTELEKAKKGFFITSSSNIRVINSHFSHLFFALKTIDIDGYEAVGNTMDSIVEDNIVFGGARNFNISGNTCGWRIPIIKNDGDKIHSDCIQGFTKPMDDSRQWNMNNANGVISYNTQENFSKRPEYQRLLQSSAARKKMIGIQGILMEGNNANITISNNVLHTNQNTPMLLQGVDLKINDNTLVNFNNPSIGDNTEELPANRVPKVDITQATLNALRSGSNGGNTFSIQNAAQAPTKAQPYIYVPAVYNTQQAQSIPENSAPEVQVTSSPHEQAPLDPYYKNAIQKVYEADPQYPKGSPIAVINTKAKTIVIVHNETVVFSSEINPSQFNGSHNISNLQKDSLFSLLNISTQEQNNYPLLKRPMKSIIVGNNTSTTKPLPESKSVSFITGNFNPATTKGFPRVPQEYTDKSKIYLQTETLAAFKKMYAAAKAEGVNLVIKSAARNFQHQASIWNGKWTGKRKSGGEYVHNIQDSVQRSLKILEQSAMPGTSRHHWGTDIDLNAFDNKYFESGRGKKEYDWLVANAQKFGFCQPYTNDANRTGYNEERWHWTYTPISAGYTKQAAELEPSQITGFKGSETAGSVKIIRDYVGGISQECMDTTLEH